MKSGFLKKTISLVVVFCFIFQSLGFAQVFPAQGVNLPTSAPFLKYLSVNSANPFNYFNFLLDRGQNTSGVAEGLPGGGAGYLNSEAKKLINYFFLGITLPADAFWVNLRPDEPGRLTSKELAKTDVGKMLLEQDFQLKKDVAKYLHPANPKGKEFWQGLYQTLGKDKIKKQEITTSNRVWIVPDETVVVETEDGALVTKASLKVLLENEYLELNPQDEAQAVSEKLMKQIILPALTNDVNNGATYAPLRQIYHSLVLAQWFKLKHTKGGSAYSFAIDKGYLKGLESELPWSKDAIWQEYRRSYDKGEYKTKETIFGLSRMYFSGGISLATGIGDGSGAGGTNLPVMTIIPFKNASVELEKASNPLDIAVTLKTQGNEDMAGETEVINTPFQDKQSQIAASSGYSDGLVIDLAGEAVASPMAKIKPTLSLGGKIKAVAAKTLFSIFTGIMLVPFFANFDNGNASVMLMYQGKEVSEIAGKFSHGDIFAVTFINTLSDTSGPADLKKALREIDPHSYIENLRSNQSDVAYSAWVLLRLVENENLSAREGVDSLIREGNKGMIGGIQEEANRITLSLRAAHLDNRERVSGKKLEDMLFQATQDAPYLLMACFSSPENFNDLAKMIFAGLSGQAKAKNMDLSTFLLSNDPQKKLYKEFVMAAANFSLLDDMLSGPHLLTEIMGELFQNTTEQEINNSVIKLALFIEDLFYDKEFKYKKEVEGILMDLRNDTKTGAFNKRLIDSIITVYRNKLGHVSQEKIREIVNESRFNLEEMDRPLRDRLFVDGKFTAHMVFSDDAAVDDHFDATEHFFTGKDERFKKVGGYRVKSRDKTQTVLVKGNKEIVLIKAADGSYDVSKNLSAGTVKIVIPRSHAGKEKLDKQPFSDESFAMLVSACRSAKSIGKWQPNFPNADFFGYRGTATGDETNILSYYLLEWLAESSGKGDYMELQGYMKEHLSLGNIVFPNSDAQKVMRLLKSPGVFSPALKEDAGLSMQEFDLTSFASSPLAARNTRKRVRQSLFSGFLEKTKRVTAILLVLSAISPFFPADLSDIGQRERAPVYLSNPSLRDLRNEYAGVAGAIGVDSKHLIALELAETDGVADAVSEKDAYGPMQVVESVVNLLNGYFAKLDGLIAQGKKLSFRDGINYRLREKIIGKGEIPWERVKNDASYNRKVGSLIFGINLRFFEKFKLFYKKGRYQLLPRQASEPPGFSPVAAATAAHNIGPDAVVEALRKYGDKFYLHLGPETEIHRNRSVIYLNSIASAANELATVNDLKRSIAKTKNPGIRNLKNKNLKLAKELNNNAKLKKVSYEPASRRDTKASSPIEDSGQFASSAVGGEGLSRRQLVAGIAAALALATIGFPNLSLGQEEQGQYAAEISRLTEAIAKDGKAKDVSDLVALAKKGIIEAENAAKVVSLDMLLHHINIQGDIDRLFALAELAKVGNISAMRKLLDFIIEVNPRISMKVLTIFKGFLLDPELIPLLSEFGSQEVGNLRALVGATNILYGAVDKDARDSFEQAEKIKNAAKKIYQCINPEDAYQSAIQALQEKSYFNLLAELAGAGNAKALNFLVELLKKNIPNAVFALGSVVRQTNNPEARKALVNASPQAFVDLANNASDAKNPRLGIEALYELYFFGNQAAENRLRAFTKDFINRSISSGIDNWNMGILLFLIRSENDAALEVLSDLLSKGDLSAVYIFKSLFSGLSNLSFAEKIMAVARSLEKKLEDYKGEPEFKPILDWLKAEREFENSPHARPSPVPGTDAEFKECLKGLLFELKKNYFLEKTEWQITLARIMLFGSIKYDSRESILSDFIFDKDTVERIAEDVGRDNLNTVLDALAVHEAVHNILPLDVLVNRNNNSDVFSLHEFIADLGMNWYLQHIGKMDLFEPLHRHLRYVDSARYAQGRPTETDEADLEVHIRARSRLNLIKEVVNKFNYKLDWGKLLQLALNELKSQEKSDPDFTAKIKLNPFIGKIIRQYKNEAPQDAPSGETALGVDRGVSGGEIKLSPLDNLLLIFGGWIGRKPINTPGVLMGSKDEENKSASSSAMAMAKRIVNNIGKYFGVKYSNPKTVVENADKLFKQANKYVSVGAFDEAARLYEQVVELTRGIDNGLSLDLYMKPKTYMDSAKKLANKYGSREVDLFGLDQFAPGATAPGRLQATLLYISSLIPGLTGKEHVLIVDLGTGFKPDSTKELADAVGALGKVIGVDLVIPAQTIELETRLDGFPLPHDARLIAFFDEKGNFLYGFSRGDSLTPPQIEDVLAVRDRLLKARAEQKQGDTNVIEEKHQDKATGAVYVNKITFNPFKQYESENLEFRQGGFDLPLKEGELADVVRVFNVMQYYPGKEKEILKMLAKKVKPGGYIIIGNVNTIEFGRLEFLTYRKAQKSDELVPISLGTQVLFPEPNNVFAVREEMKAGGSGKESLFRRYNELWWDVVNKTAEKTWYDFSTEKREKEVLIAELTKRLSEKGYEISRFGETTLVFNLDAKGNPIQKKETASSAIENLIGQAEGLLESNHPVNAIAVLEGLSSLFVLKQLLEKDQLWFSERSEIERLAEFAGRVNALDSLGMDKFLQEYFQNLTDRLGHYRIRVNDLPFNYQLLSKDISNRVDQLLLKAYKEAGSAEFLRRVKAGFKESDGQESKNILRYLSAINEEVVPDLIDMLEKEIDSVLTNRIIWLLGQSHDSRAVDALLKIIEPLQSQPISAVITADDGRVGIPLDRANMLSSNWLAIRSIVFALGELRDVKAVKPLIGLLDYPVRFVVEEVISALVKLDARDAVEPLIDIVMNEEVHFSLRQNAVKVLGDLKDERAVNAIKFFLMNNGDLGQNVMLITPAVTALWKIGTETSFAALSEIFRNDKEDSLAKWIESSMGVSFPMSYSDPDAGAAILALAGKLSVLPREFFADGSKVNFPDWVYGDYPIGPGGRDDDMLVNRKDATIRAVRNPDGKFRVIHAKDLDAAVEALRPLIKKFLLSCLDLERTSAVSIANEFELSLDWLPSIEAVLEEFKEDFVNGVSLSSNFDGTYFIIKEPKKSSSSVERKAAEFIEGMILLKVPDSGKLMTKEYITHYLHDAVKELLVEQLGQEYAQQPREAGKIIKEFMDKALEELKNNEKDIKNDRGTFTDRYHNIIAAAINSLNDFISNMSGFVSGGEVVFLETNKGVISFKGFGKSSAKEALAETVSMLQEMGRKIEEAFDKNGISVLAGELKDLIPGQNPDSQRMNTELDTKAGLLSEKLSEILKDVAKPMENAEKKVEISGWGRVDFVSYDLVDKLAKAINFFRPGRNYSVGVEILETYLQLLKDIKLPQGVDSSLVDKMKEINNDPELTYKLLRAHSESQFAGSPLELDPRIGATIQGVPEEMYLLDHRIFWLKDVISYSVSRDENSRYPTNQEVNEYAQRRAGEKELLGSSARSAVDAEEFRRLIPLIKTLGIDHPYMQWFIDNEDILIKQWPLLIKHGVISFDREFMQEAINANRDNVRLLVAHERVHYIFGKLAPEEIRVFEELYNELLLRKTVPPYVDFAQASKSWEEFFTQISMPSGGYGISLTGELTHKELAPDVLKIYNNARNNSFKAFQLLGAITNYVFKGSEVYLNIIEKTLISSPSGEGEQSAGSPITLANTVANYLLFSEASARLKQLNEWTAYSDFIIKNFDESLVSESFIKKEISIALPKIKALAQPGAYARILLDSLKKNLVSLEFIKREISPLLVNFKQEGMWGSYVDTLKSLLSLGAMSEADAKEEAKVLDGLKQQKKFSPYCNILTELLEAGIIKNKDELDGYLKDVSEKSESYANVIFKAREKKIYSDSEAKIAIAEALENVVQWKYAHASILVKSFEHNLFSRDYIKNEISAALADFEGLGQWSSYFSILVKARKNNLVDLGFAKEKSAIALEDIKNKDDFGLQVEPLFEAFDNGLLSQEKAHKEISDFLGSFKQRGLWNAYASTLGKALEKGIIGIDKNYLGKQKAFSERHNLSLSYIIKMRQLQFMADISEDLIESYIEEAKKILYRANEINNSEEGDRQIDIKELAYYLNTGLANLQFISGNIARQLTNNYLQRGYLPLFADRLGIFSKVDPEYALGLNKFMASTSNKFINKPLFIQQLAGFAVAYKELGLNVENYSNDLAAGLDENAITGRLGKRLMQQIVNRFNIKVDIDKAGKAINQWDVSDLGILISAKEQWDAQDTEFFNLIFRLTLEGEFNSLVYPYDYDRLDISKFDGPAQELIKQIREYNQNFLSEAKMAGVDVDGWVSPQKVLKSRVIQDGTTQRAAVDILKDFRERFSQFKQLLSIRNDLDKNNRVEQAERSLGPWGRVIDSGVTLDSVKGVISEDVSNKESRFRRLSNLISGIKKDLGQESIPGQVVDLENTINEVMAFQPQEKRFLGKLGNGYQIGFWQRAPNKDLFIANKAQTSTFLGSRTNKGRAIFEFLLDLGTIYAVVSNLKTGEPEGYVRLFLALNNNNEPSIFIDATDGIPTNANIGLVKEFINDFALKIGIKKENVFDKGRGVIKKKIGDALTNRYLQQAGIATFGYFSNSTSSAISQLRQNGGDVSTEDKTASSAIEIVNKLAVKIKGLRDKGVWPENMASQVVEEMKKQGYMKDHLIKIINEASLDAPQNLETYITEFVNTFGSEYAENELNKLYEFIITKFGEAPGLAPEVDSSGASSNQNQSVAPQEKLSAQQTLVREILIAAKVNLKYHPELGYYDHDPSGERWLKDAGRGGIYVMGPDELPSFKIENYVKNPKKTVGEMIELLAPLNPDMLKFSNHDAVIDFTGAPDLEALPANVNTDLQIQNRIEQMLKEKFIDEKAFVIISHGHFIAGGSAFAKVKDKEGNYLFDVSVYFPKGDWSNESRSIAGAVKMHYQLWSEGFQGRKESAQKNAKGKVVALYGHRGRVDYFGGLGTAHIDPYKLFGTPEEFRKFLKENNLNKVVIISEEYGADSGKIYEIPLERLKEGVFRQENKDLYPYMEELSKLVPVKVAAGDMRPVVKEGEGSDSPLDQEEKPASSAMDRAGGIDFSKIELTLKDEKFVSTLAPADLKILRAAKYLNQGWDSLSLLYVHEVMLLFKDNIAKDIVNKELLSEISNRLKAKGSLDSQAIQFMQFIHAKNPSSEKEVALLKS